MNFKKLALAGTAFSATVFCTTVFADGAVESANVVGYSTTTTIGDGGFTQITPFFTKVNDKTKISLSDLAFTPERDDNIQLFDQDGNVKESFTYCRKGNKTDGYTFYWENLEGNEISDYDFPRGSSLWINTASQIEFTQSGAVQKEPTIIEIPGDGAFAQAGNNTPVDIKLSQLVFSNINRDDNIQIFDKDGNVSDALTYCRKGNKTDGYTFYWEDLEGNEVDATKYNFSPGQVFWANCAEAGTLTIPAPTF